jgi:hypothetical protein
VAINRNQSHAISLNRNQWQSMYLEEEEEQDGGYSANLYEEHLQELHGILAPKYNQTKHNRIDSRGPH